MNNNSTFITIIVILLILLVGVGVYTVWSNSQKVALQNTNTTANTSTTTDTSVNTVFEPQAGAPMATTDSINSPYISTVVVSGTVNPNGDTTTYWFDYGTTSSLGSQSLAYVIGSGFTGIYAPAYITGLRPNTNYYFRLTARNNFGTTSGAIYSFKTNSIPVINGASPTTKTSNVTSDTRNSVTLNGQINPNGSLTTYWFEYGTSSGLGSITSLGTSVNSGNSLLSVSINVSNLKPFTKYYFRLNAQNQFGTVNGQILNFTTKK